MKGRYLVKISRRNVDYELDIERPVTIIKGNSGTGKTTIIQTLLGFLEQGKKSGAKVSITPEVQCSVFTNRTHWEQELSSLNNCIIFVDESVDYVYSEGFQKAFCASDNYLVVISRSGEFNCLPYAINSIFELQTSANGTSFLTRMYRVFEQTKSQLHFDNVITEDSKSGMEIAKLNFKCPVITSNGNGNVMHYVAALEKNVSAAVIVDGAAFGGFIERTLHCAKLQGHTTIFAPESFECILLQTEGYYRYVIEQLTHTWDYCDSATFLTWEQYYTNLLEQKTQTLYGFKYSKNTLQDSFRSDKILHVYNKCVISSAVVRADKCEAVSKTLRNMSVF